MRAESAGSRAALQGHWWDCSRARVVYYRGEKRGVRRTALRLFRRPLQTCEYAALAGAPDDAEVEVGTLKAALYLEMYQPVMNGYHAVDLVRLSGGGPVVTIDALRVHPTLRRMGLGLRIFARQLAAARALGVARIEILAGRGGDENGYYTWPRFGFDGPLPAEIRPHLPPGLEQAQNVLDLVECGEGRAWWQEHGAPIHLAFDLAAHSRSWAVFERYVSQVACPADF